MIFFIPIFVILAFSKFLKATAILAENDKHFLGLEIPETESVDFPEYGQLLEKFYKNTEIAKTLYDTYKNGDFEYKLGCLEKKYNNNGISEKEYLDLANDLYRAKIRESFPKDFIEYLRGVVELEAAEKAFPDFIRTTELAKVYYYHYRLQNHVCRMYSCQGDLSALSELIPSDLKSQFLSFVPSIGLDIINFKYCHQMRKEFYKQRYEKNIKDIAAKCSQRLPNLNRILQLIESIYLNYYSRFMHPVLIEKKIIDIFFSDSKTWPQIEPNFEEIYGFCKDILFSIMYGKIGKVDEQEDWELFYTTQTSTIGFNEEMVNKIKGVATEYVDSISENLLTETYTPPIVKDSKYLVVLITVAIIGAIAGLIFFLY